MKQSLSHNVPFLAVANNDHDSIRIQEKCVFVCVCFFFSSIFVLALVYSFNAIFSLNVFVCDACSGFWLCNNSSLLGFNYTVNMIGVKKRRVSLV